MSDADMDNRSDLGQKSEVKNVHRRGRGFKQSSSIDLDESAASIGRLQMDLMDRVGENSEKSIEGWTVGVTGIHREATEDDVLDRFAEFGEVKTLHLNLDRHDGYVKGYALVEYEFFDQAKEAVAKSDCTDLLGQEIRVDFSFVKPLSGEVHKSEWRANTTQSISQRLGPRVEHRYGDDQDDSRDSRRRNDRDSRYNRQSRRDSRSQRSPRRRNSRNENRGRVDWDHPENNQASRRRDSDDFSDMDEGSNNRHSRYSDRSASPRRR